MPSYILDQIKVEGALRNLIAKSTGSLVSIDKGEGISATLGEELANISAAIAGLPTPAAVESVVSGAIDALIDGAPGTYDTLKEIADYIAANDTAVDALNAAIGSKVDKEDGKGLSAEDFTTALKEKLESLQAVAASGTNGNLLIGGVETAVYTHPTGAGNEHVPAGGAAGQTLVKTEDGCGWGDPPKGVRYGTAAPGDLQDGELFVRVIS